MFIRKKKLPVLSSKQKEDLKDPVKALLLRASIPLVNKKKHRTGGK
jgi:hypothetical protein